eukprot:INCI5920.6.p1 GENE.INCI5920.6~~INCI5920.6.p1  ORF type:complete len:831 (-),score=231.62 INCI5920.6:1210-3489(-)
MGGAGEARGVLDVLRYKKHRLDPILVPLIRKTLVVQPQQPLNFMHTLLGSMLSGEHEPDYSTLKAENVVLKEQVRVLGLKLAEAQVALSHAELRLKNGGGPAMVMMPDPVPAPAVAVAVRKDSDFDDDEYGDGGFDDDEDEEGDAAGEPKMSPEEIAAKTEAALTVQRLQRGRVARADAKRRREDHRRTLAVRTIRDFWRVVRLRRLAAKFKLIVKEKRRLDAASNRIYKFWRAVRLRKLAAMFGDIVKAHRKMEEEEAARRAAHEAKALALVAKRQKARMVRSQTKKQIKEAEKQARKDAVAEEAARAKAQADAAAAKVQAAKDAAQQAKLKAKVHKSVAEVVVAPTVDIESVPSETKPLLQTANAMLHDLAQAHTEHVRGFKETPLEAWQKAHSELQKICTAVHIAAKGSDEVLLNAEHRLKAMLQVIEKHHLNGDDDSQGTADGNVANEGFAVKRTETATANLLALNPEGDIRKSDTEFYGEMFGGGGGADDSYDLEKRREMAAAKAKKDAENAKKAKLLKARMESGIRIGAANKAERQAELAAAQARAAKEAYERAKKQEVHVMKTIEAETEQEMEAMNWLVGSPKPLTPELIDKCLQQVQCPSKDVVLTVGLNGAWATERGFIEDVKNFVLDYGSTQAAMENLDAAEVLAGGFSHERFWDVVLGAVVSFVLEWQEAVFVIAVGSTPEEVAAEAKGDPTPKIRITDEFVSIIAEAVEIAAEEVGATTEQAPDALAVLFGWARANSGESPVTQLQI